MSLLQAELVTLLSDPPSRATVLRGLFAFQLLVSSFFPDPTHTHHALFLPLSLFLMHSHMTPKLKNI